METLYATKVWSAILRGLIYLNAETETYLDEKMRNEGKSLG